MSDGTLQTLDASMLEDVNNNSGLVQLDSNAKIPACSAAAVTNLPSITKSSSDPTRSTNPSGGVGTVYQNTTSGDMFVCTDATAGSNVWTNVGTGSGDVEPYNPRTSNYGYMLGGHEAFFTRDIQRWSYTSDGNATDVGDLICEPLVYNSSGNATSKGLRYYSGAYMSATHGYVNGGNFAQYASGGGSYAIGSTKRHEKIAFASPSTVTNITELRKHQNSHGGANSGTHGYLVGGMIEINNPPAYPQFGVHGPSPADYVDIDKFTFASDSASVDSSADLTTGRNSGSCVSSTTHGFYAGGYRYVGGTVNIIDKFPFASSSNATDHGDCIASEHRNGGQSMSATHGFAHGGQVSGGTMQNVIQKFAFSSNTTATDHGDLTGARAYNSASGASTQGYGYSAGGYTTGWGKVNVIEKYAQASSANATDVGDLANTIVSAHMGGICQS